LGDIAGDVMRAMHSPNTDPELIFRVSTVFQDRKKNMEKLLEDVSTESEETVR
jgi:hypothetical protein